MSVSVDIMRLVTGGPITAVTVLVIGFVRKTVEAPETLGKQLAHDEVFPFLSSSGCSGGDKF